MKDPKGHGSSKRGGTGTQGMRLLKTHVNGPHSAKVYNNPDWEEKVVKFFHNGEYQPKADYHTNDTSDAHDTAQHQLGRYITAGGEQMASNATAASHLAGGSASPKAAAAPVHDAHQKSGYNEHGSRHGYSPDAVNKAIAAQNRSGRGRIGGKEASMIHRLLKGR